MISFSEIQKFFSETENNFPRAVLREYLQYKILEIIFSSSFSDRLVFMGGISIRLVYGGDRFSEDLDFDNLGLSKKDFDGLTDFIKSEFAKEGVESEYRNIEKGIYRCYFRFPELLYKNKLSSFPTEKILIQIDTASNKKAGEINSFLLQKGDIFSEIKVYFPEVILAQKIYAMLNRKRAKGRDIYDTIYLYSLTEPDWKFLKKKINVRDSKELKKKLYNFFPDKQLKDLAKDLEPFLLEPEKVNRVEKFNLWVKDNL